MMKNRTQFTKRTVGLFILFLFLLIPTQAFAVDYDITDVEINAHLKEDGSVSVEETHTYSFSGEFGGIIRTMIPKTNTEITELKAFEGTSPLTIETDEFEHRIHRSGDDETINIILQYQILNGVEKYADVAEFYWPFFDKSNESTYENMTINVFPPTATTNVIAFGYDEAYEKESLLDQGQVQFQMGEVPSEENGDIRVAYDAELFPAASMSADQPMKGEILGAEQQLIDEQIAKQERKDFVASIGKIVLTIAGSILGFILLRSWLAAKGKKAALLRELSEETAIPSEKLSLPATIFFTNHGVILPETVAAALLDLVRKGLAKKLEEDRFQLVNRTGILDHEEALIQWLFDEVGSEEEFSFDHLADYTKVEENHEKYNLLQNNWQKAIRAEVKEADLYEKKGKTRWTLVLLSAIIIPFSIAFIVNDLIGLFFGSLVLFAGLLVFAISYHPRTWDGAKILLEWRKFKDAFPNMAPAEWEQLSKDDKMSAFIYGLGINEKNLNKKNESLVKAFKTKPATGGSVYSNQAATAYGFDPTWLIIGGIASNRFKTAQQDTTPATSSGVGGSSGGGGSGAGGGGGGSGAF